MRGSVPTKAWEGLVADLPDKYNTRPIPADRKYVVVYTDGSRTFHNGLVINPEHKKRIERAMRNCAISALQNKESV